MTVERVKDVVESADTCGVPVMVEPVVIVGGAASSTMVQVVDIVDDALSAGAAGLVIGRNVWQRSGEVRRRLLGSLVSLVHGGILASSALEELEGLAH